MDELGFDFADAVVWFQHQQANPYVLVRISKEHVAQLPKLMADALRRCYIADSHLIASATATGSSQEDVLMSKLPDPGSIMAGDFGEVLGYFYQSATELPATTIGAKKWRLKQDRTKAAPKSDVIHFIMPHRPASSTEDAILCAEVKVKSTAGKFAPISAAIEGCSEDRTSRLAKSLVWLRERARTEDLGDVDIPLLNRFIESTDHFPASKRFRAMAIICESLETKELLTAPATVDPAFSLVVIVVPQLKGAYEAAFSAARATVPVR